MSQEDVVALLDCAARDATVRERLQSVTSAESFGVVAASVGFDLRPSFTQDLLADADLDGIASAATDRTCRGTTDCCPGTNRTCFGTTDCCR